MSETVHLINKKYITEYDLNRYYNGDDKLRKWLLAWHIIEKDEFLTINNLIYKVIKLNEMYVVLHNATKKQKLISWETYGKCLNNNRCLTI